MNSKQLLNWSGIFLLFAAIVLIIQLISPSNVSYIFYILIMAAIFNVGASIMKGIESLETKQGI